MIWIVLTLIILIVAADFIHYRRLRRRTSAARTRTFALFAAATDLLPFAAVAMGWLAGDNTTTFMHVFMWIFFVWMITVLPRAAYYFFALFNLRRLGIAAAVLVAGVFVWSATIGRTSIHVTHTEVASPDLPAGFDGLRVVQFTDTHIGSMVNPKGELQRIVDAINGLDPDIVIFTGDLVNIRYTELDETAEGILRGIRAPYGVVSISGNHDLGTYIRDSVSLPVEVNLARLFERERAMGWQVLDDESIWLHRGGDSITVSGVSFDLALRDLRHDPTLPEMSRAAYRDIPDSVYNITAVHLPQLWPQATAAGYGDLTLSGHVHSMQMKIKLFGRSFSPAQFMYDRWSGRYDENGSTLYINDGTGYVGCPMRIGAWPEIALITLKRCG